MLDVIIIGAGVVGAFISRELSKYELSVLLIDKENDVGNVTSMANSAIVHSGYDPLPGTKKAIFNVAGNKMYSSICEDLDVQFNQCGSLTIAINEQQFDVLNSLLERAKNNGVDARIVTKEELFKLEPNVTKEAKGAIFCPTAGIVDPFELVSHCVENAIDNGIKLSLNEEVIDIVLKDDVFIVKTNKNTYEAACVINASGLNSDKLSRHIEDIDWEITPRKGEYFVFDHFAYGFVNRPLFPLPSEKGKGILVSLTTSGNYYVGPSSESVNSVEDFSTDSVTLNNVKSQSLLLVPSIPWNQQIRVFSGLRATCTRHDFVIEPAKKNPGFIICGGIESPGLASSPAIAKYVVEELVSKVITLKKKSNWNPKVKKYKRFYYMTDEEKQTLIKENPHYGQIVCNCEQVTLGHIEDVLSRSVPVNSIKALKKRSRASFGRCQGSFCQPKLVELLAKYKNVSPLDIVYDKEGSIILLKESK